MALAAARETALGQLAPADGVSVIALPPPATAAVGAPLEVYGLGRAPGDDHRLTLSADGRQVLAVTPIAGDLTPTEVDAYRSLKHDQALEIVTTGNGARWRVVAGQISLLP